MRPTYKADSRAESRFPTGYADLPRDLRSADDPRSRADPFARAQLRSRAARCAAASRPCLAGARTSLACGLLRGRFAALPRGPHFARLRLAARPLRGLALPWAGPRIRSSLALGLRPSLACGSLRGRFAALRSPGPGLALAHRSRSGSGLRSPAARCASADSRPPCSAALGDGVEVDGQAALIRQLAAARIDPALDLLEALLLQ